MTSVFSHGRLRLYLLKLLDDGPKHGYELIRLLEDQFLGLYAPSAGTIYPRLQRLEVEGLVTHHAVGGRKIYEITEAGREELRQRAGELVALELDIRASVADLATLAGEIQNGARASVRNLRQELRAAARATRRGRWETYRPTPAAPAPYRGAAGTGSAPVTEQHGGTEGQGGTEGHGGAEERGAAEHPGAEQRNGGAEEPGAAEHPGAEQRGDADAAAEFDRHLAAFVAEVRALVHGLRLTEGQLRTAVRALDGALDGLRRLLR